MRHACLFGLCLITFSLALPLRATPAGPAGPMVPRAPLVLVDDRAVPEQVDAALLVAAVTEIEKRTGVTTVLLSTRAPSLSPADQKALAACKVDACLADAGKKLAADVVVTVRVRKTEGVLVLTASRITALARLKSAEEQKLALSPATLSEAQADALAVLFPLIGGARPKE